MLLVILGAGASYDAVAVEEAIPKPYQVHQDWRPPLAKDLFEARESFGPMLNAFPECRGLVVELRSRLRSDPDALIERLLEEVEERARGGDSDAASQLMAVRFYIRQVLDECGRRWSAQAYGATNYHALVSRFRRWTRATGEPVLFVTFNYDRLLEDACIDMAHMEFTSLDAYVSDPRLKIFKPHGSVDWAHPVTVDAGAGAEVRYAIRNAVAITTTAEFSVRRDWNSSVQGQGWVPAVAIPIERKAIFECPAAHMAELTAALPRVERVLVIGWRATEEHFLNVLGANLDSRLKAMLVVCKDRETATMVGRRVLKAGSVVREVTGFRDIDNRLGFSALTGSETLERFLAH